MPLLFLPSPAVQAYRFALPRVTTRSDHITTEPMSKTGIEQLFTRPSWWPNHLHLPYVPALGWALRYKKVSRPAFPP